MAYFEWDKAFELGVEQFDEHHRHLIALLNETYDNFTCGTDQASLGAVLDKLIDYATYHFAAEEEWMSAHGYNGLAHHHKEHHKFTRRVVEIQNDFHNGKAHLSLEVLVFLKNWLSDHILKTDADYGRFAAEQTHA